MDDRLMGALVLLASLAGVVVYFYMVFLAPWAWLVIQLSSFLAVVAVLFIIAWIGYSLAFTPPPVPLEGFNLEKEFEVDDKAEN